MVVPFQSQLELLHLSSKPTLVVLSQVQLAERKSTMQSLRSGMVTTTLSLRTHGVHGGVNKVMSTLEWQVEQVSAVLTNSLLIHLFDLIWSND